MMATPNYATREFVIPANGSIELYREADEITCLAATAPFKIGIDHGGRFDFEAGLSLKADEAFSRLVFENETGAPNTVKLGLGKGGVRDARLVISGTLSNKPTVPDTFTTGAAVACVTGAVTVLAAQNFNRAELVLVVDTGAPGPVYVGGDAGAAAGEGMPIQPGQSYRISNTAAVYARNDTGASVNVHVAQDEYSA